jgi:hypothetical protein
MNGFKEETGLLTCNIFSRSFRRILFVQTVDKFEAGRYKTTTLHMLHTLSIAIWGDQQNVVVQQLIVPLRIWQVPCSQLSQ